TDVPGVITAALRSGRRAERRSAPAKALGSDRRSESPEALAVPGLPAACPDAPARVRGWTAAGSSRGLFAAWEPRSDFNRPGARVVPSAEAKHRKLFDSRRTFPHVYPFSWRR